MLHKPTRTISLPLVTSGDHSLDANSPVHGANRCSHLATTPFPPPHLETFVTAHPGSHGDQHSGARPIDRQRRRGWHHSEHWRGRSHEINAEVLPEHDVGELWPAEDAERTWSRWSRETSTVLLPRRRLEAVGCHFWIREGNRLHILCQWWWRNQGMCCFFVLVLEFYVLLQWTPKTSDIPINTFQCWWTGLHRAHCEEIS